MTTPTSDTVTAAAPEDRLQTLRQPLVTATGIILGFVLNFASSWVKSDTAVGESMAFLIFALVLSGMACLITVLARILRLGVPPEHAGAYYATTVRIFIIGVSLAVGGVVLDMAGNFWSA